MKVDYQNTIIYKLCCKDPEIKEIYVGHTTNFKLRNNQHKKCCNNPNNKNYNIYNYQFIRDNGGYENWKMIEIKKFPCSSRREAEMEEDKVIRELKATLNSHRAFVSQEEKKEWQKQYEENRKNDPQRIEYIKEYQENRKQDPKRIEYLKENRKKRYEDNKEEINKKNKEWQENNKEYLKEYEEKRKQDPKRIEWKKEYYEKLKQKVKCEFCNCELNKGSLKRHLKENKKCLAIQEQNN